MMTRREVPALPTRLVNPRNKKQRWPQPSQPGLGDEQRLKGVEVAKLLRLHSQAPTASVGYDSDSEMAYQKHQKHKPNEHQGSY